MVARRLHRRILSSQISKASAWKAVIRPPDAVGPDLHHRDRDRVVAMSDALEHDSAASVGIALPSAT